MKLTQGELFSIIKSEHILRVQRHQNISLDRATINICQICSNKNLKIKKECLSQLNSSLFSTAQSLKHVSDKFRSICQIHLFGCVLLLLVCDAKHFSVMILNKRNFFLDLFRES